MTKIEPATATALIGFYFKNKYYVSYQESHGHPSLLGQKIVQELRSVIENDIYDQWKNLFHQLKIIGDNDIPSAYDIQKLKPYTNLLVSRQSENDWYCLTYECRGSLGKILESGYLYNYVNENWFPYFQDYAYILNFDSEMMNFYEDSLVSQSYYLTNLPDW